MVWIYFIATAAVIIFAGAKLSVLAEKLAGQLNISSSTVGLLLVSVITSLPELATSLSAAVQVGQPGLAAGNTIGSDLFNLMIIALCDTIFLKKGILRQAGHHTASLRRYLLMISMILLTLTLPNQVSVAGMHFNAGSLVIIALYLVLFFRTHHADTGHADAASADRSQLPQTLLKFCAAAAAIVLAGMLLAQLGDQIAKETGLEQSFVGTLFLALATSLPELTVSITAVRIGAFDLMVGNVVGSNMFNVFVTALSDVAYTKEAFHIPENISPSLLFIGGCTITMTLISLIAVRQKRKAKGLAWESVLILLLYVTGLCAMYFTG
ncbi:MAG: sodium:calcium antiporter [Kiritimatiellales bacterium]|nr:sodium:calcium antiporter [Kiritimatiellota bacterium]MBL7011933.1 sodium:calcium antiporter [Kiritimatiellales bacterium]